MSSFLTCAVVWYAPCLRLWHGTEQEEDKEWSVDDDTDKGVNRIKRRPTWTSKLATRKYSYILNLCISEEIMSTRTNDESRSSFPSSSPLSSLRSPSPVPVSEPSKQRSEKRRGRRQKQNSATSYELRPRGIRQEGNRSSSYVWHSCCWLRCFVNLEPDENQSLETPASGHFTKAETEVLKDTFNKGVWTPGNITVRSLKKELKERYSIFMLK